MFGGVWALLAVVSWSAARSSGQGVAVAPGAAARTAAAAAQVSAGDGRIALLGRYDRPGTGEVRFGYPASGFVLRYGGDAPALDVESEKAGAALTMVVDEGDPVTVVLAEGRQQVPTPVPAVTSPAGAHTLTVVKRTETWQGVVRFYAVRLSAGTRLLERPVLPVRRLMFVGDSVTCGAGVGRDDACKAQPQSLTNDAYRSYGAILGRRMDARAELVCYGGRGVIRDYRGLGRAEGVLNAPEFVSLAIPTDDPKQRAGWDEALSAPDAIVVSLGTNDFSLQAKQPLDAQVFPGAVRALLQHLLDTYPRARVLVTNGAIVTDPPLLRYLTEAAEAVHSDRVTVVPGVHYRGNGCDAHPTAPQHGRMADDLEPILRGQLGW